jgi:uncharacterized protein YxeA
MKKIVLLAFVLVLLSLAVVFGFVRPTKTLSADGQPYITTENANNTLEYRSVDINDPLGSIVINNNDTYTNSTSVTLTLTYASNVSQVRYSNDGVWDTVPWESPSTTKAWTLTAGDGTKTVYYEVNASSVYHTYFDTIILDTTPPTISFTSPSNGAEVRSSTVLIVWNAVDATSGLNRSWVRLDAGPWFRRCNTCSYYTFFDVSDGNHTVEVRAYDKAGNSRLASVNFTVNTSPIGGLGYAEEQVIIVVVILVVAIATATYLLKTRKKTRHKQVDRRHLHRRSQNTRLLNRYSFFRFLMVNA